MIFLKRMIILIGCLAVMTVIGLMIWVLVTGGETLGFLSAIGIGLFFVAVLTI